MVNKSNLNCEQEAWEFYNNWRKTPSFCPAFKQKVVISLKGWNHLTGKSGNKKRSFNDKYRRLKLLPYAKELIETSSTIQNVTVKHNISYFVLEAVMLFKHNKDNSYRKIRVVFVEDKNKNKIFYSVMDKKTEKK